jgi:hypothetical protein
MSRFLDVDEQIAALAPLDAHTLAVLAGYTSHKQFNDYRAKGRLISNTRLERLATRLEQLATLARNMKKWTKNIP